MIVSAYHVRPAPRSDAWRVELKGAPGHESLGSQDLAHELAGLLARANRPSLVVVHEATGEVRVRRYHASSQAAPSLTSSRRPDSRSERLTWTRAAWGSKHRA